MATVAKKALKRIGKTLRWAISSPEYVSSENILCPFMGWAYPVSTAIWLNGPKPLITSEKVAEAEQPRR